MKTAIQGLVGLIVILTAMGGYHLYIENSIAGEVREVIEYIDKSRVQDRIHNLKSRIKELETKRRFTELTQWEQEELTQKRTDLRELCRDHRRLCL